MFIQVTDWTRFICDLNKIFSCTLKLETAATVKLFRWLNSEGSASKPHEAGFTGAVTAESFPLRDDWVLVGLCYPSDSTFQIMADINDRQSNTFDDITDYGAVSSLAELEKRPMDRKYFFDQAVGLLWLHLRARHGRDGHSYCSVKGCERVKVMSSTSSRQTCNCTAKAYPKYSRRPSAAVPMPARNTQPCRGCGAQQVGAALLTRLPGTATPPLTAQLLPQLVFSSEPWTSHLQTQVKSLCLREQQRGDNSSFISVNGATMPFSHVGYFVVAVDACSGKISQKTSFARMDTRMEEYLRTGIPDRSLVLVATRGRPEGLPEFASHLVSLGFAKTADLSSKECVAVWAFRGGSPSPPWVSLQTGRGDDSPGLLERYVPVNLETYGCTPRAAPPRKDLELLRAATAPE
ncbi:Cell surface hyaluronidase [Takifugu flavidus]|uniref:Cell surface hyaluronidase n=1 Tax=Takifugu flavidus TaxID=433684 RepID=A0A5C6MYM0_9TELE|nr:Cell surface hyaluronidase [Takifugu flavidus]